MESNKKNSHGNHEIIFFTKHEMFKCQHFRLSRTILFNFRWCQWGPRSRVCACLTLRSSFMIVFVWLNITILLKIKTFSDKWQKLICPRVIKSCPNSQNKIPLKKDLPAHTMQYLAVNISSLVIICKQLYKTYTNTDFQNIKLIPIPIISSAWILNQYQ